VCTDRDVKKSKKSTELALLLGVTVVCLYLFGLFELMQSMPELSARLRHYHVGGNLNLAKMEMGSVVISSHPRSDDEEDGESDSDEEDGESYSDSQDGESDSDSEDGEVSDSDSEEDVEEIPRNKPNHDGTNNNQNNNNNNAEPPSVQAQHHGISRGGDDIPIPVGTWPVSVRHEELETMVHVGDLKTIMEVPKFWSPPVHNHQPFTREQAMQIGTCAKADPSTGSHVRGEDCPMLERTIFIGIASYRDYQCRQTLETAFRRAANPNRIRVGVVDQIVVGEDVACNEPMKPCEDDPEQVRIASTCALWIASYCVELRIAFVITVRYCTLLYCTIRARCIDSFFDSIRFDYNMCNDNVCCLRVLFWIVCCIVFPHCFWCCYCIEI
jgi:hypothetical protein